jgi:hypothetical protein
MKPLSDIFLLGLTPTKFPVFGENVKILFLFILSFSDAVPIGLVGSVSKQADLSGLSNDY